MVYGAPTLTAGAGIAINGTVISATGLIKQADTGAAGFPLQNATPNILTWTAPNDGNEHQFILTITQNVTVAETGGSVQVSWTGPDGSVKTANLFAGTGAVGVTVNNISRLVAPGTTVTVSQNTALTVGAATVWAQIYG